MSRAAGPVVVTARRPRLLVRVAVKVAVYLRHFPSAATSRTFARVPAASRRATVRVVPLPARDQIEKSYLSPFSTRMPVL
ncbi:hypothetical protein RKD40_006065 [Streptomyces ambofaciens]